MDARTHLRWGDHIQAAWAGRAVEDIRNAEAEPSFAFGPYKLLPQRKILLKSDQPHVLGSRALDLLTLLVDRAGEVVSKEDLFAHAWPNTYVEEINLRVHVAALRKALGDGQDGMRYILNHPGRGYCFAAPVMRMNWRELPPVRRATAISTLPMRLTPMIGRGEVVAGLAGQLDRSRFVSIVGPGGIGKTTVALAAASALAGSYEHGVHFVDLAPLHDAALVPSALASALGLSIASDDPLPGLVASLVEKSMLILLDNCEHVVGAAAALAEAALRASARLHVLATSREALRAEGEWIHRLAPMEVPETAKGISAADAQAFPAVQLFVERAAASSGGFALCDETAPDVVALCQRLDGLPLAIELAAARINLFGAGQLAARLDAARLDDRLLLFGEGRRTALPRHQTLHATLEWSYGLLTEAEQAMLRAVSIYRAAFTVDCAVDLRKAAGFGEDAILAGIESLAAKSLLKIDAGGAQVKCRLLDSTRAFALGKLREAGELPLYSRLHAEQLVRLLTAAEADWDEMNAGDWLALYQPMVDDIRAALSWSLAPEGDVKTAAALTAAAVPLWMHLSLTNECGDSVAKVIARIDELKLDAAEDKYRQMKLLNALGLSMLYTKGPGPQIEQALEGAGLLAQALGDVDYQLRSLWGIFVAEFNEGNYPGAKRRAENFRAVAKESSNPHDLKAGDRLLGFALHLLGQQSEARFYIEGMLKTYVVPTRRSDFVRFQYDQRVAARVPLSAILWLQGFADQAMDNATRAVEEAQSINHAISLGYALSTAACPTAFFTGDLAAAERFVAMLADHSAAYGLGPWSAWGRYFKSLLAARHGQLDAGLHGIGAALNELRRTGFVLRFTAYLAEYAALLGAAGRTEAGLGVMEEALARCRREEEGWCFAELLRVKGELLLRRGLPDEMQEAEMLFRTSIDHSARGGTPAWELRAATSLAKLLMKQDRRSEGQALLAAVYGRFTEGFASFDLVQAKTVLQNMYEAAP